MPQVALIIGVVLVFSIISVYYLLREIKDKRVVKVKLFE